MLNVLIYQFIQLLITFLTTFCCCECFCLRLATSLHRASFSLKQRNHLFTTCWLLNWLQGGIWFWFWSYSLIVMILESMLSCFPFINWKSLRSLLSSSGDIFTSSWRIGDTWTNDGTQVRKSLIPCTYQDVHRWVQVQYVVRVWTGRYRQTGVCQGDIRYVHLWLYVWCSPADVLVLWWKTDVETRCHLSLVSPNHPARYEQPSGNHLSTKTEIHTQV